MPPRTMQLGMIGLGRMGAAMVERLLHAGHNCVVYDTRPAPVQELARKGAVAAADLQDFVGRLTAPRALWLMVPAAFVGAILADLLPLLASGDIILDEGNSCYQDDVRRARQAAAQGVHYVDVGTSGGIWGLARGCCLMIGGESAIVQHLGPIFSTLAPGIEAAPRTPGRERVGGTAEHGYLHCGPSGAGHFVKMVHNGIEYGLMAAYAERLNILHNANAGVHLAESDAETAPLHNAEYYRYDLDLPEVAEVWRRGSVIGSWLLDLTATALLQSPTLDAFSGQVSDSGEGRWTVQAAVDEAVPAPVLGAALYERFASRGASAFSDRVLSAIRFQFGGHAEKAVALGEMP